MSNKMESFSPHSSAFSIHSILNNDDRLDKTKHTGRRAPSSDKDAASTGNKFGPVRVTLENRALWDVFHKVGTEMVITKSGRRMFPAVKVTVQGLNPNLDYSIMLDVVPADNYRYKYHESEWLVTGKAYPDVARSKRLYVHPESPSCGAKWMSTVISFHKLKITNNTSDSCGHVLLGRTLSKIDSQCYATFGTNGIYVSFPSLVVLNSLHKYQPRVLIVQSKTIDLLNEEDLMAFVFPETVFMAVTAYQSEQITQLKIDNNPFAKGFRDPSPCDLERARLLGPHSFGMLAPYGPEMYPGFMNADGFRQTQDNCLRQPFFHNGSQSEWHSHIQRDLVRGDPPAPRMFPEGLQLPLHARLHKQMSYPPCNNTDLHACGSAICLSCCHNFPVDHSVKRHPSSPPEHAFCSQRSYLSCYPYNEKDHSSRAAKHGCSCIDGQTHEPQSPHKRIKIFDGTAPTKPHVVPCSCQQHRLDWNVSNTMRGRFPSLS